MSHTPAHHAVSWPFWKRFAVVGLVLAATMAPVIVASLLWAPEVRGIAVFGFLTGIVGTLKARLRLGVVLSAILALATVAAVLSHVHPAFGALLMAALAAAAGLAAMRGLHTPVLMVPLAVEFLLVSPPPLAGWEQPADAGVAYALAVGLVVLLGGLWASAFFGVLARRLPRPALEAVPRGQALTYTVALTVGASAATYIVLRWYPDGLGAWLIMTVLLLLQPDPHRTLHKTLQRIAGTIFGVAGAAAVLLLTESVALHHALGSILFLLALSVHTKPYWRFVTVLTPAIVLLASEGADGIVVDERRLTWTLAGAALAVVVTIAVNGVLAARSRQRAPSPAAPPDAV